MKKMNLNKKSTEFGTFHENENAMNSSYSSLEDYYTKDNQQNNEQEGSSEKEECYDRGCQTKRNRKSNR